MTILLIIITRINILFKIICEEEDCLKIRRRRTPACFSPLRPAHRSQPPSFWEDIFFEDETYSILAHGAAVKRKEVPSKI